MKNQIILSLLFLTPLLTAQSVESIASESNCGAGGEIWVCGSAQKSQVHVDFDNNCSEENYMPCTVIKTVVDVCSPDMSESTIFEPGGPGCPLNN